MVNFSFYGIQGIRYICLNYSNAPEYVGVWQTCISVWMYDHPNIRTTIVHQRADEGIFASPHSAFLKKLVRLLLREIQIPKFSILTKKAHK